MNSQIVAMRNGRTSESWVAVLLVVPLVLGAEKSAPAASIGDKLPNAKLIWVRGGKIMYSPIKNWKEQQVTSGTRPRWAPDGTRIVYESGGGVWLMNGDFSGKTKVISSGQDADWIPGENAFTYIEGSDSKGGFRVLKYNLGTKKSSVVYDAKASGFNGFRVDQNAELRKGGRYLLTFKRDKSRDKDNEQHQTYIVDLQAKKYIMNSQMARGDCNPAWAPDGSYILNTARESPRPVMRGNFNAGSGTMASSTYYYKYTGGGSYYIHGQRISSDGKWLVCGVLYKSGSESGNREIYAWEIGTSNSSAVRLTKNSASDAQPSLYVPSGSVSAPAKPSNLAAKAASSSQIDLTWSDNSANESGFKVERKTGSGSYAQIATVGAGTKSYADGGLTASTPYTYRVLAYNGGGNSSWSSEASATTDATSSPVPTAPTNLAATAASPTEIQLTWKDNSTAEDGFNILRRLATGGTWVKVASVGKDVTTYADAGLQPSTEYRYAIRAFNSSGESLDSNKFNETTLDAGPAPSITVVAPNGGETLTVGQVVEIKWDVVVIDDCTLRFSPDGGKSWVAIEQGVGTSHAGWLNYSWTVPSVDSTNRVIEIEDYFGNVVDASDSPFTISSGPDTAAPVISFGELLIEGTINDLTLSTITADGAPTPVISGTFAALLTFTALPQTVELSAEDAAGNQTRRMLDISQN